jgi:hypothetical protein
VQQLQQATLAVNRQLLVPLVQALANMATACQGEYVSMMLSNSRLVETLGYLIGQRIVIDAVALAGCLLVDCGLAHHPSTMVAAPVFLPTLIPVIVNPESSHQWRLQAAQAIATALEQPPSKSVAPTPFDPNVSAELVEHLWQPVNARAELMEVLAGLLGVDDLSGTFAALAILDELFRTFLSSRQVFASVQGARRLDDLCNHHGAAGNNDLREAQSIAAYMLDLYFDESDDDNDDHDDASMMVAPSFAPDGHFAFGLAQDPPSFGSATTAFDNSHAQSQGRGRGRPIPAWMQQQHVNH